MALPKNIQAQVEAANALLGQPPVAPETSPAEPPAAEVPATEPPAQETAQAPVQQSQPDVWESKYKTLQGLFNAEVPKLQGQVKELTGKYQQAIERLEKLATQAEAPKPEQKPTADPRDVENFGSDLVDMVQRVATKMLSGVAQKVDSVVSDMQQRIDALERNVQGTTQAVAVTAEQSFFDRLYKLVPDWEAINASEAFLAWLAEVDPVYGQPRQAALNAAQSALDANRAASVFKAFTGNQPKPAARQKVDSQISPKAVAASAPVAQDKPILTEAQVVAFYNAKRRGEYTPAEAAKLEQVINEAIADGRVR